MLAIMFQIFSTVSLQNESALARKPSLINQLSHVFRSSKYVN